MRHVLGMCVGGTVNQAPSGSISQLLGQWQAGDAEALGTLVPLVYADLRQLAHRHLRKQQSNHTLQSTALVHEAYLRLARQEKVRFENRVHFFAVAARIMRQILVDHARGKRAAKRDSAVTLVLDEEVAPAKSREIDLLLLDDALQELSRLDARQSQIVELRYFGGLSIEETSEVMRISPATVKREWSTAKLWLRKQVAQGSPP